MSDSLRPYGPWPARLLCPWASPGKNTGVGCRYTAIQSFLKNKKTNNLSLAPLFLSCGSRGEPWVNSKRISGSSLGKRTLGTRCPIKCPLFPSEAEKNANLGPQETRSVSFIQLISHQLWWSTYNWVPDKWVSIGNSVVNKQSPNVTWGCGGTWGKGWVMSYNVKGHGAVWVVAGTFPPTSFICSVTRFLIRLSSCLTQLPCHRHLQLLRSVRQQRALSL